MGGLGGAAVAGARNGDVAPHQQQPTASQLSGPLTSVMDGKCPEI